MKFANALILTCLAALNWSCVSEATSGCILHVAVADKNYDNAAAAGDPVFGENLPMTAYVASLAVNSRAESLSPTATVHTLDTGGFANGTRELAMTAAGVARATSGAEGAAGAAGTADPYFGYDATTFPLAANRTVWLYRANGKLVVAPENTSADVVALTVEVDGVYAASKPGATGVPDAAVPIIYSGSTTVTKRFDIASGGGVGRFDTLLAPSVEATSPLRMTFTSTGGATETVAANVAIARNHITVVRPAYNPPTRKWTISVMVDGRWIELDNLSI
jgi:hypothetical protein